MVTTQTGTVGTSGLQDQPVDRAALSDEFKNTHGHRGSETRSPRQRRRVHSLEVKPSGRTGDGLTLTLSCSPPSPPSKNTQVCGDTRTLLGLDMRSTVELRFLWVGALLGTSERTSEQNQMNI